VHFLGRQIQVSRSDILHRKELQLFEPDHLVRDVNLAMVVFGMGPHRFENFDLCVRDRIREVIVRGD